MQSAKAAIVQSGCTGISDILFVVCWIFLWCSGSFFGNSKSYVRFNHFLLSKKTYLIFFGVPVKPKLNATNKDFKFGKVMLHYKFYIGFCRSLKN